MPDQPPSESEPLGSSPHDDELPGRVLVADDESLVATHITDYLEHLGIRVVGPAANGVEALELAQHQAPDLALLDIRMPQMDGLEAAGVLYHRMGIPVVLLSAFSDATYIQQGAKIGVFGYLIKPVNPDELRAALAVAWSRFRQQAKLRGEVDELKFALEERKLIERAKGLMMERLSISEPEAMRRLQKQARDTRRRLADVARGIVEGEQMLRPKPQDPPPRLPRRE